MTFKKSHRTGSVLAVLKIGIIFPAKRYGLFTLSDSVQSGHERLPRYLEDSNSASKHFDLWLPPIDYRLMNTFFDLSTFLIEIYIKWLAASDFDRATIDVSGYFSTLLQYLEREVVQIANLAARLVVALEEPL